MDYQLSDEQKQIKEEVRRFAENEIAPVAQEYDVEEKFPHEVLETAAEMGLTGANIPMEYGGAGYNALETALIVEEMFAVDPGIALSITATTFGSDAIMEFGNGADVRGDQATRCVREIRSWSTCSGTA